MPAVLAKRTPDVFFQDSLHDYDGVVSELKIILPHLKPTSVVLFHDFVLPDVRRAAIDVLCGYNIFTIAGGDPQLLGLALPPHYDLHA